MLMGLCCDPPCLVTEYCSRGSLLDVLQRATENMVCRKHGFNAQTVWVCWFSAGWCKERRRDCILCEAQGLMMVRHP